jgi:formylglycine-generating enzyme required for sulfatase activity
MYARQRREWCADWYGYDYYQSSPRKDPTGPATGTIRVVRGGSFLYYRRMCRSAYRLVNDPGNHSDIGFRVVLVAGARTP